MISGSDLRQTNMTERFASKLPDGWMSVVGARIGGVWLRARDSSLRTVLLKPMVRLSYICGIHSGMDSFSKLCFAFPDLVLPFERGTWSRRKSPMGWSRGTRNRRMACS